MKVINFDEKTYPNDYTRSMECLKVQGILRANNIKFELKDLSTPSLVSTLSCYEIILFNDEDYTVYQLMK